MKIRLTKEFQERFNKQLDFIAADKPGAAKKFKTDILVRIKEIPKMPFKYKVSPYFNEDNIRELTFKGYTVIYRINDAEDKIDVFGFMKYVEKPN